MNGLRIGTHLRAVALLLGATAVMAGVPVQAGSKAGAASAGMGPKAAKPVAGVVEVNGINLAYETMGRGRPLVLLLGGPASSELFGPNVGALAKAHKVIAVQLQAHDRGADADRRSDVEMMADDVEELIVKLDLERPDVMGYSLAGVVALQVAIRHPKAIGRLVVVSTPLRQSAYYPDVLAQKPSDVPKQPFDASRDVAEIAAPTLIVAADADIFPAGNAAEFFGLLGGGARDPGRDGSRRPPSRLAILPGLTHETVAASPLLGAVVIPFLDEARGGGV